ncbi:MAG: hypothetical protein MSS51_08500 [Bacteroidales bacterium]|nr:hypothetical protein [Bacteroidales bacterium]
METTLDQILNGAGVVPIDSSLPGLPNGHTGAADAYAPEAPRRTQQAQADAVEGQRQPRAAAVPPPIDSSLPGNPYVKQYDEAGAEYRAPGVYVPPRETAGAVPPSNTEGAATAQPAETKPKRHMSYAEMTDKYFASKLPTEEQLKADQKRRRREAVYSALGDGIAALANIYTTNQYAPNVYDPSQSLSKQNYEKWQKLTEQRKADAEAYYNARMRALQADDLQAIRQQNADANEAYKKSEAKRKQDIAAAQNEALKARAAKDTAATALAEKKLEYLIQGWPIDLATKQAKLDLTRAQVGVAKSAETKNEAQAAKTLGGGKGSGNGSSSSGGSHVAWDENGKEYHFKSEAEAIDFAKRHGTYQVDYGTSTTNKLGIKSTTTSPHGGHRVQPPAKPKAAAKKTQQQKKGTYSNFSIH